MYAVALMRTIEENTGKNIGVMKGGGDVRIIVGGDTKGRIRGDWYEMWIKMGPRMEQHSFPYTESEHQIEIELRTTMRNRVRGQNLLEDIGTSIRNTGGYVESYDVIRPHRYC